MMSATGVIVAVAMKRCTVLAPIIAAGHAHR
jgi:hypothetical protein